MFLISVTYIHVTYIQRYSYRRSQHPSHTMFKTPVIDTLNICHIHLRFACTTHTTTYLRPHNSGRGTYEGRARNYSRVSRRVWWSDLCCMETAPHPSALVSHECVRLCVETEVAGHSCKTLTRSASPNACWPRAFCKVRPEPAKTSVTGYENVSISNR